MTSADLCRRNQWTVGTVLRGVGDGPVPTIRITAIGEDCVLACGTCGESEWSLMARKWTVVPSDEELLHKYVTFGHDEDVRDEILRRMKEGRD